MVYIHLRLNVADYAKWRAGFDAYEPKRRAAGSSGVNQIFCDLDDPHNVTLIMEWDQAEHAKEFLADPMTKQVMDDAGVTGRPSVVAVQVRK